MSKRTYQANPRTISVFEDLERLQEFCREYGYRYNEADLYNFKVYVWQQFSKFAQGKNARNMWDEELRRMAAPARV
jgi:hypothetical protein